MFVAFADLKAEKTKRARERDRHMPRFSSRINNAIVQKKERVERSLTNHDTFAENSHHLADFPGHFPHCSRLFPLTTRAACSMTWDLIILTVADPRQSIFVEVQSPRPTAKALKKWWLGDYFSFGGGAYFQRPMLVLGRLLLMLGE